MSTEQVGIFSFCLGMVFMIIFGLVDNELERKYGRSDPTCEQQDR